MCTPAVTPMLPAKANAIRLVWHPRSLQTDSHLSTFKYLQVSALAHRDQHTPSGVGASTPHQGWTCAENAVCHSRQIPHMQLAIAHCATRHLPVSQLHMRSIHLHSELSPDPISTQR